MLNGKVYQFLYAIVFLILWNQTSAGPGYSKRERSIKLPSFLKICHRSDPQLNKCARNALYSLKDRLEYGIPELYIPAMEPLVIPEIKMNQDTGAVYIKSSYKNVEIYGMSRFAVKSLHIDANKMKFTTTMLFPNLTMHADYEIDGKIMMMPMTGSGRCNANFTDVTMTTVILGERQKKNGRTYFNVKDITVNYNVGKVQIHLNNLFNGDNALGERMNAFLNENWDSLSEELRPLLEKAFSRVIRSSTDKLFKAYSYDELLPK
ncbi:protein takeout [Musca vetustissima]|uniref:protein takeout n=1 Tax=Musca vetustissima TaxID=27455 RepID=UPI002AB7C078|nr:protein takeout [Musca vetustissima]